MFQGYGAVYSILKSVRDSVVSEMQTRGAVPNRVAIMPGAIAWDECDECGLLALSASRLYLTDDFPLEVVTTQYGPAGALLAADCTVQIIRCAPTAQGTSISPTVAALDASAQTVLDDAFTVMCSTSTLLRGWYDSNQLVNYMIRSQSFVGPSGACVGSELTFSVGIPR